MIFAYLRLKIFHYFIHRFIHDIQNFCAIRRIDDGIMLCGRMYG